ncbi:transcriptional regulator family: Fungal Specific TF [Paecilomyces variotii]|nr:transcriptional regulator family: Fungal Specific TF [Paecilomyces variotii]
MGDPKRSLPTLAPGPRTEVSSSAASASRPKKNSTACLACKQAKRKCSGRPSPCKACEGAHSECIFDETLDLRRKIAVKRTKDELEYYKELLYSLIESLRSSEPSQVAQLLDLIRSNAPLNEIAAAISENIRQLRDKGHSDPQVPAGLEEAVAHVNQMQRLSSESYSRRKFVTLQDLCDVPLFEVPAKPWTDVTDDSHFVSHLASLYFTWSHPSCQFIDQELFLAHMMAGDLNSRFCSPFLVNSLLAVACMYSDFEQALAVPGDASSRGQHFHAEAERLWKEEDGKVSLTNLQGVILMVSTLNLWGKDKLCWLMLRQAVQMAQDLELLQASELSSDIWQGPRSKSMEQSSALTACGLFILNAQMTLASSRQAAMKAPTSRPYTREQLDDNLTWTPYPRSTQIDYAKKPALLRYILIELSDLSEILVDMQDWLFNRDASIITDVCWNTAMAFYSRLQKWHSRLPTILDVGYCPVPQVLVLQMQYHEIVMALFGDLVGRKELEEMLQPSQIQYAKEVRIKSAREIGRCSRIERQSYGLNQAPGSMLRPVCAGLVTLLRDLGNAESRDAFVELSRFLAAFSRRAQLAQIMIRMLEDSAKAARVKIPAEAATILKSPNMEAWRGQDLQGSSST